MITQVKAAVASGKAWTAFVWWGLAKSRVCAGREV